MTISSLLRHHGVAIPRFVTVDGRIVFDGVTNTTAGPVHETHGPVTPVTKHTFHGGVEREAATLTAPWWTDSDKIQRHETAMQTAFPQFVRTSTDNTPPAWTGTLDTGRGQFRAKVQLRADEQLPSIRVLGTRLGRSKRGLWHPAPHLYLNGNLCVADVTDWNPEAHTAATATGWAAHWLAAYTEWRMSDFWPVDGAHHGALAA